MTEAKLIKKELGYEYKGIFISRRKRGWSVTKTQINGVYESAGNPWLKFGRLQDATQFIDARIA